MKKRFERTQMLLGEEKMNRLSSARVAVFGVGGVGGYVVEALARSGVGALDLIDNDEVDESNINRQIIATYRSVGRPKVEVAKERVLDINPDCDVTIHETFYLPENAGEFDFTQYDYVVDAIDTVTGKIALVLQAKEAGVPIISAMGAGNKLDPTAFEVADLYDTSVCPLAKVMRKELKMRGVDHLKVVYSREKALTPMRPETDIEETVQAFRGADCGKPVDDVQNASDFRVSRRSTPGSIAFVPSVVGLIIAGEVLKDLCGIFPV